MGWFSIQYQVICKNIHLVAQDRKLGSLLGPFFLFFFFPYIQTNIWSCSFYVLNGLFTPTATWKFVKMATVLCNSFYQEVESISHPFNLVWYLWPALTSGMLQKWSSKNSKTGTQETIQLLLAHSWNRVTALRRILTLILTIAYYLGEVIPLSLHEWWGTWNRERLRNHNSFHNSLCLVLGVSPV